MENASELMNKELLEALKSFRKSTLDVQKELILESRKQTKLYLQIWQALNKQNLMLDNLKENNRLMLS